MFRFLNAVAITGSLASPSRGADLGRVMLRALEREHAFQLALLEKAHLARPLGQTLHRGEATREFKHFLDLLNPEALREVPVLLGTTGHHADQQRLIEDAILPVVTALGARPVQISLFASDQTQRKAMSR